MTLILPVRHPHIGLRFHVSQKGSERNYCARNRYTCRQAVNSANSGHTKFLLHQRHAGDSLQ